MLSKMKHFMQPRSTILRENSPSMTGTSPSSSPNTGSVKQRSNRKHKSSKENAPPADLNSMADSLHSPSVAGKPSPAAGKVKSPLPPRPPNSLKRKLNADAILDNGGVLGSSDSGVKVIVRMRPPNKDEEEGDLIVQKSSSDSLSIVGQTFTFDSVADVKSTQLDIFQRVGAPLVENCLAGFNSSVFAYGQTGSGKTYTIWGPTNALLEENLSSDQQGLTPRVFERLFSRIDEEQNKHTDKQLRYQCRCSFLEIYNEQITDLLEPSQRNLQIREDVKSGVYVENLREECVCTMKDVTQLLMKGLSNRSTGATSINAESSRSHSVFTCVVESRCKGLADGLSCFKSSRINLVDLAGSERQKLTGAAGERLKEAGNINRSLSQLGNLINILAEVSQTGKQRHIPYRDSKLTFLLQESLGGNAKLAMVCAISPEQSCKSETFSTLRFAQRAKAIKNKAVVNEEMQDDVNVLREVIRQLKDELFRIKEKGNQTEPNGGYSTGWNARRSLNLLKFSLNRPMILPRVDDDGDEEMEIIDQAEQIGLLLAGIEENNSMDGKELERVQLVDLKHLGSTEGLQDKSERVSIEEQVNLPVTGTEEKNPIDGRKKLEAAVSKKGTLDSQQITSEIDYVEERGSENTDVNMKEENTEQVDNKIITVHCGKSGRNVPIFSKSEVQYCTEGNSEENLTSSVKITEKERVSIEEQVNLPVTGTEEKNPIDGRKKLEAAVSKKGTRDSQQITSEIDYIEERGSENTDVNMKEENTEQVDNKIITVHCGKSGRNVSIFSKSEVQYCTEGNSEENLTSSVKITEKEVSGQPSPDCIPPSVSSLLNEEISRKSVMDIPSCAPSQLSANDVIEVRTYPSNSSGDCADPSNLSIVTCEVSPVLKSPTPSVSPRLSNGSRKNLRTSSTLAASQNDLRDSNLTPETVHLSFAKPSKNKCLKAQSTQTSKHYNGPSEHLAASLQRGLEILDSHRQSSGLRRSSFRFSYKPGDIKPILQAHKVDVGVQTLVQDNEAAEADPMIFLCSKCKTRNSQEIKDANERTNLQLVAVEDGSQSAEKSIKQVPKAVEKVLAGAIRREMALEEYCAKKNSEIMQLNRLIQQYKHERECNAIIGQTREDKIVRLESLMDGILCTEDFVEDELVSLTDENKILRDKYENHPELLSTKIELKRVQDELERYRNFYDMGERDVLVEEIQDLRSQLQYYTDASPKSIMKRSSVLQLTYSCEPSMAPSLCPIPESTGESAEHKLEMERIQWTEAESKWISLAEELRAELEASRMLAEKQNTELDMEKKCSEELKVSMQMAMEGHARMIEQYADLQEKHIQLLDRHRRIQDGIEDVKKAAAKAGVRGAESKFINTLAAEISALKVEREKERRYLRDENKGLQAQLRDTVEAVQAAGELLVRLKEAEEAITTAQNQAAEAELETEKAYKQIDKLKRKHEKDVSTLNQLIAESRLPKGAVGPPVYDDSKTAKYDAGEPDSAADQQWRHEFEPLYNAEEEHTTRLAEPSSWFSGYDRCNV